MIKNTKKFQIPSRLRDKGILCVSIILLETETIERDVVYCPDCCGIECQLPLSGSPFINWMNGCGRNELCIPM